MAGAHHARCKLWIDTDAGVDDALAIALALSQPDTVDVVGISLVRGNVSVAQGLVNVSRVMLACCVDANEPSNTEPSEQDPPSAEVHEPKAEGGRTEPKAEGGPTEAERTAPADASLTHGPPAFIVRDVPVFCGADAPLAGPPLPLTNYYGRDGLGDVPDLPPTEAETQSALRRAATPLTASAVSEPSGWTAADRRDAASLGGGDCGGEGSVYGRYRTTGSGTAAAAALVAAARREAGRLVLVALGPLTNVAAALRAEPRLPSLLRCLVVLGGSGEGERGGNVTPFAEYNFYQDPEAADEVLRGWAGQHTPSPRTDSEGHRDGDRDRGPDGGCPSKCGAAAGVVAPGGSDPRVALVTWQACERHLLPWPVVEEMTAAKGQRGRFLAGILAPFLDRWRRESPDGMLLGDPLAVAVAVTLPPSSSTAAEAAAAAVVGPAAAGAVRTAPAAAPAPASTQTESGPAPAPAPTSAPAPAPARAAAPSPAAPALFSAGEGRDDSGGSGGNSGPHQDDGGEQRGSGGVDACGDDSVGGGGVWGPVVLESLRACCRVELRGERRGASIYGVYDSPCTTAVGGTAAAAGEAAWSPVELVRCMDMEGVAALMLRAAGVVSRVR